MPRYRDIDGDSGILSYQYGEDWITVEFERGAQRHYKYTYASAGAFHVDRMKMLADQGYGLNSYINKNVAKSYETKW